MRKILEKIFKSLAYLAAALVILLAVAVGLFRLLLPRLPEYQEEIKGWANAAIGMQVEFGDMHARWRLSGPELTFQDAELTAYSATTSLLTAGEVNVGVSLLRLLRDRELVVDRIHIRDTKLTLQFSNNDGWLIEGMPIGDVIGSRDVTANQAGDVVVIAEDIAVDYLLPDSSAVLSFALNALEIARDEERIDIEVQVELPKSMGTRLDVSAVHRTADADSGIWQFFIEGKGLELAGWSSLDQKRLPQLQSGSLDLSASLQRSNAGIDHMSADLVIDGLTGSQSSVFAPFDAQGRVEYSRDQTGWLIAASNVVMATVDGVWPRSSLSVSVGRSRDNEVQSLSATASYLNLEDVRYVGEWLPDKYRQLYDNYDPSGVLRELRISFDDLQSENPRYDISTELVDAGVAAGDTWPGIRRMSGLVRTDNAGGRLEIAAAGIVVDLASQLAEPISFDDAAGTIIWRRNSLGTIILSDSVKIRNADLDSQSSLQISLPADGGAADVDFQSNWSIHDVSAVKRYLPAKLIKPGLYNWLGAALVAGDAPSVSVQLSGPLDKFPFDNGEGIFRVEGHLENTTLRYSDLWPDSKNMTLDIVVDGMRLYSHRNSANNADNSVVDAKIEVPDLRNPVLSISAYSTGTLASIREFSRQSPIAKVFGGHLEAVTVGGDASFNLEFSYPILDRTNYSFSTRIQTSDGSLSFEGFEPQLTQLNGFINVSRDGVSSEGLFGRFLGEQINIEINSADASRPSYSVIAETTGNLTDVGLFAELAPELEGIIAGESTYTANVLFPDSQAEQPAPFKIVVESDLQGMAINLPVPLDKSANAVMPLSFSIEFPKTGQIDAIGSLSDESNWILSFLNAGSEGWDFDRGALALGGIYPDPPETRGLHIVGETDSVRLDDWLNLARSDRESVTAADRIRSIDLTIGALRVIGQDLKNHRVQLDRSAQDWLVTVAGEQVSGSVSVPYDFSSGRPLVVDMDTLILPGLDEELAGDETDETSPDPRNIPPLNVRARNFALGPRFFGELSADFRSTARGLETDNLTTRDPSFVVDGSAGWIVDQDDASGQRTFINAVLKSSDIATTMKRLDYQLGIEGEDLEITLDVGWSGGPGADFLQRIDGSVGLRVGVGKLDDVEPGAGRVFGLMSVVALPRRLSLDFGDVFDTGFGFDKITGDFRLEQGQAYTCNLVLEGPAADVGIVGRAGIASRDYHQTAVVSANVGNTLPVLGLAAGPQVAAALLIFSQLFKKPLQEVGQRYYAIDGSWDEPLIAISDPDRFAQNSRSSGCIVDAQ